MLIDAEYLDLVGIQVATANIFQGYDAQVVYYDFTTSGSDHGKTDFVADKQRNAVTMIRHKSKPMPIGDTSRVGKYSQKRQNVEPRASYDFEAEVVQEIVL